MATGNAGHVKRREILLSPSESAIDSLQSAADELKSVAGVLETTCGSGWAIVVEYDLRHVALQDIEQALMKLGFALDDSLSHRLRRAISHITEENQLALLQPASHFRSANDVQDIFVSSYEHRRHGCRDSRPLHWREYH
jgi:hypothetical protein